MTILSKVIDNDGMRNITAEFSRLKDRCYLESSGTALYPQSLLKDVQEDLIKNVYMNPHTDKYTKDCIEQIRCSILRHFNTDPSTYTVVFTSGTTQSLKLVVESFQFANKDNEVLNCGAFIYLRDNHTSVLGLREIAKNKNADIINIPHNDFLNALDVAPKTTSMWREKYKNEGNTLLVYPAQSNFNGYKYPINCIETIKTGKLNTYLRKHLCKVNCNWYVLLDAASFVSTNKLDLTETQPDFVCLSFYKVFGYPTGLGALIIKNSSQKVLNEKLYFGGGTVDIVLSSENFHVKRESLHERFEDGTNAFLSIIALKHCFDTLQKLIPRVVNNNFMDTVSHHTFYLAQDLYIQLKGLRHKNGKKATVLYMDSDFTNIFTQGSIVTFNIRRADDSYIGYSEFQHVADLFNINIRTGCFCNSGSCQRHLMASNKDMKDMYKAGHRCGDEVDLIEGRPTGAVRASFGYYNTFEDVDKLMLMICQYFLKITFKKPKRQMNDSKYIETTKSKKPCNEETMKLISDDTFFKHVEVVPKSSNLYKNSITYLEEIVIFPIKSCGSFKIGTDWKMGKKGFEYDREWMIVKENGVCLTQKHNPHMCMIRPIIDLKRKVMILNHKGASSISVSLELKKGNIKDTSMCQSRVCTDIVQGYDCGDEVGDWISQVLQISFLRLIRQSNERTKSQKLHIDQLSLSLSNQAQYLLINKATVRWLRDKIQDPSFTDDIEHLTDRFRGNLIINTNEELIEGDWQRLIIGKHEFRVDGPCRRCQMICIDQNTGEKTSEPLRTISEQLGGKIRFGIYLSYVGAQDGSADRILKVDTPVYPLQNGGDIER